MNQFIPEEILNFTTEPGISGETAKFQMSEGFRDKSRLSELASTFGMRLRTPSGLCRLHLIQNFENPKVVRNASLHRERTDLARNNTEYTAMQCF
jgi:hypothetical protein